MFLEDGGDSTIGAVNAPVIDEMSGSVYWNNVCPFALVTYITFFAGIYILLFGSTDKL